MARFMRTDLGRGHSSLRPPIVVSPAPTPDVNRPIQGRLHPVDTTTRRIVQRRTEYLLRKPVVVTQVVEFVARPVQVFLADAGDQVRHRGNQRATLYRLRPPVVIDLSPQTKYLSINLAYSRRGQPKSVLRKPTDTVGLEDQGRVRTRLAPQPKQRRVVRSRLRQPIVVFLAVELSGPKVMLAVSSRGKPKSRLQPPTVVVAPAAFVASPIRVSLVRLDLRRRLPHTHLPLVVVPAAAQAAMGGTGIQLVQRPRPSTRSRLFPPATITAVVQVFYAGKPTLVRIRPQHVHSVLRPPADTVGLEDQGQVNVTLVPSPRRPRARSRLFAPTVVTTAAEAFRGPAVHLTRIAVPHAKSKLLPPAVVGETIVYAPIFGKLFPLGGPLPKTRSVLHPPVAVTTTESFYGPQTVLAQSRRGQPLHRLSAPAVIDNRPQAFYLAVTLAYSRRGTPKSRLGPPTVVDTRVYYGPAVSLTYSRRGTPRSVLRRPTVINTDRYFGPSVTLAPSVRGKPKSRLSAPTVVTAAAVARPTLVHLAYSRRLKARYGLAAPAVVFIAEPVLYPVAVTLAYSVRGKPKSRLGRPAVVGAVVHFGPTVNLTYSRRGRTKSELLPPAVVGRTPFRGIAVHLTYSRYGRSKSLLKKPTVVGRVVYFGPTVSLAPQHRGVTKSFQREPSVVRAAFVAAPVQTHLVRIRPARTRWLLRPSGPEAQTFQPVTVHLAYSRRGKARYGLAAPAVIAPGVAFFGPTVTLVTIKPPPVLSLLKPPTTTAFVPPAGDVCGFDIAGSFDCGEDTVTGDLVIGYDQPGSLSTGMTEPGSTIQGSDDAIGDVCGTDQEAT